MLTGGYGVATGGPLAWGLYYNKEMSPSQYYSELNSMVVVPCLSTGTCSFTNLLTTFINGYLNTLLCWNYNYGAIGETLKLNLLDHPEYIEQNATMAFQAAVWRWMNPTKKGQPSAHDAFVGNWKPTKNDTLSKRLPGFGTTNILYGDSVCGKGDVDAMNNIISHFQYYLVLMGVGGEEAGSHEVLTCGDQKAFNPTAAPAAASWDL
ncbi:hypothetical protein RND71_006399 [Anisodus tanguticus]|uniref:Glycoside hydrolase family 19 catalytic domain-containing protein n=1 Tax=Anisodus tanguticus TaxID=243964 RepID=A0AAE1SUZ1_9SOLA|nr:hypothetical protein RND71_006399 [Anisodus tanguticus]